MGNPITDKLYIHPEEKKKSFKIKESTHNGNRTCCHRLICRAYLELVEIGTIEITLIARG